MSDALQALISKQQARAGQAIDLYTSTAVQVADQTDKALQAIETAVIDQGKSREIALRTARLGQLQAQEEANAGLQAAGGSAHLNALITRTVQKGEETSQTLEQLRKARNTTFFGDGPLAWISAKLAEPTIARNLIDSAAELDILQERAATANNMVQERAQTAQATAQTINKISINAETDALAAEWAIQAQRASIERLKNNLVAPAAIMQAEPAKLDLYYNAANYDRQQKQFAMSLRQEARQAEHQAWLREERVIARNDRLAAKAIDEKSRQFINAARVARGESIMEESEFQYWKSITPKERQEEYVQRGMLSVQKGFPIAALSPADAAGAVLRNPGMQFEGVRNKMLDLVKEAMTEASRIKGSTAKKDQVDNEALIKDKTGQATGEFINRHVAKRLAEFAANMDSPTNPLNFGSLNAFIGTETVPGAPVILNTPLVASVLGPATKAGISLDSPSATFKVMLSGIQSEKISSGQAIKDFVAIHKIAAGFHRESLAPGTIGATMPEGSQGYRVTINGKVIDVTNITQVSAAVAAAMYQDNLRRQRAATRIPGVSPDAGMRRTAPLPGQFPGGFEPQ